MRERPDIAAVSRDRGGEYASAASQAVPWAVQVADKFHLAKNLTEATHLLLARCQAEVLAASHARRGWAERIQRAKTRVASSGACTGGESTPGSPIGAAGTVSRNGKAAQAGKEAQGDC